MSTSNQNATKPKAGLLYDPANDSLFFNPTSRAKLQELLNLEHRVMTPEEFTSATEKGIEILLTGWGAPSLSEEMLDNNPNLKLVIHLGGSVKGLVGKGEVFNHNIQVSSTNPVLAESVAEFCLAQIILAGKRSRQNELLMKKLRTHPSEKILSDAFPLKVGLIGYGTIARHLRKLLLMMPYEVCVYDPYVNEQTAVANKITLCSLEEVFQQSDVVSCHLPNIPDTQKLLKSAHFKSMKKDAAFINTGRGQVVDEGGFIAVFKERKDLYAYLDVVTVEPIPTDHPLHDLDNVILTPHIAGSLGQECNRFGLFAINEIKRWLAGEALQGKIDPNQLNRLA